MTKLSHTPGPWKLKGEVSKYASGVDFVDVGTEVQFIATVHGLSERQARANAALIAEAGTVATETGMTPRQLVDSRTELLDMVHKYDDEVQRLKGIRAELLEALQNLMWRFDDDDSDPFSVPEKSPDILQAHAAIKNATK